MQFECRAIGSSSGDPENIITVADTSPLSTYPHLDSHSRWVYGSALYSTLRLVFVPNHRYDTTRSIPSEILNIARTPYRRPAKPSPEPNSGNISLRVRS